jgi:hypothetical protein
MNRLKFRVEIVFFWLPILISLLLNPGRNGYNIDSFSQLKLWVLLFCGLIFLVFMLLLTLQPKQLLEPDKQNVHLWDWLKYFIAAGFMAIFDIYYSSSALF